MAVARDLARSTGFVAGQWSLLREVLLSWRLVGSAAALGVTLGLAAAYILPSWYEATAQLALMAVDDPTSPGLTNAVEGAGAELPLLATLLRSRQVADSAITRLHLDTVYGTRSREQTRLELWRHLRATADRKANLVTLVVEDRSPPRARDLAVTLAESASQRSAELWSSRSREHRERLAARLADVGRELERAEQEMQSFRERTHVVELAEQVRATVAEAASLEHLQIEKQLGSHFALGYGARDSSEVRSSEREVRGVRRALGQLIRQGGRRGPLLPFERLPAIETEHDRLKRVVEVASVNYQALARQVEQLRAVEARSTGRAAILDPPALPERRIRPARAMLAGEGAITGLLVGAALVVVRSWRRWTMSQRSLV